MAPPPGVAPSITTQPSINPASAFVGDSITLSLGAASGTPGPSPFWTLTRGGVDVTAQVDEFLALQLALPGVYTLSVTWSNASGTVVSSSASITVAAEPAAPRLSDAALHLPTVSDPSAALVTPLAAQGRLSASLSATAGSTLLASPRGIEFDGASRLILTDLDISSGYFIAGVITPDALAGTMVNIRTAAGQSLQVRRNGTALQCNWNYGTATNSTGGFMPPLAVGTPVVFGVEVNPVAGTVRMWDGSAFRSMPLGASGPLAVSVLRLGGDQASAFFDGAIRLFTFETLAGQTISFEQALAELGAAVTPSVTLTSAELLVGIWQSEGQPRSGAGTGMTRGVEGQAVSLVGLKGTDGADIPITGGGLEADGVAPRVLNTAVPASGFRSANAELAGRASIPFFLGYDHARREIAAGHLSSGAILGGNAYGGLRVERFRQADAEPYGRNQFYWMQQVQERAAAAGISVSAPHLFHFVGTSGKTDTYAAWKSAASVVWDEHRAEMNRLFGAVPSPLVIQNGGDTNGVGDLYEQSAAQYDMARDYGGHILLSQRSFLINDNNIHMATPELIRQGERAAWGRAEIKAGRKWTPWASVTKSGSTVTVTFDLRPGESLVNRAALYAPFGGDPTCVNYGFEAGGGVSGVTFAGNTVSVTLSSPSSAWMRFALQRQDVRSFGSTIEGAEYHMSAHRTTLAPSETRPSESFPGETMWRDLPSFSVLFSGDAVQRLDGSPFVGAPA